MDFLANTIFTLLDNLCNHDQNLVILKRKLVVLNAVKEDNESKKSVELQPRKKLKKEVEIWFQNVERINGEILNDLENEVRGSSLLSRGFLGEKVLKRIQEVEELLQQGKSYDGLVIDDPQWIGQVLSTSNLCGEVAENLKKEILAYLMDDDVSKIGVWGMGGVGKTTIMKHINNQLLKENERFKFNPLIWVTVSKETNIAKLQNDIASAMNVSLSNDDETRRSGELYEMLARKGKYVLILDDLWDNLSLEEVGIPEPSAGSKLVITTRLRHICHYLNCQVVRMPTLPIQDARSLFLQKVGQDILDHPNILSIVESVVEQCAGLPLAIVTVASSMKGVLNIHEWRNALNELNRHAKSVNKSDEKVLQQLQFSYDRLEDETFKQCFLCCALYPEDSEICTNKLIELWTAEGIVEELDSMQEETDRGHTILNKLINNCLLENIVKSSGTFVKLHDLVRDMALCITSLKPRFLVRAGMQLKEIPDLLEWAEDLDKVSLMKNSGIQIPPEMLPPKCHMLTTLLLPSSYITSIPESFFEQMHGLKILDLSLNPIKSLPNSISDLETLISLLLFKCVFLEDMPSFSKLLALKKLNLEGTKIKNLPHGMERLVNLKYLNLSDTGISKVPDGILSKFSRLQHFVGHKRFERSQTFARADEIGRLRKLEIFEGRFYDLKELSSYVQALHGQTHGPREYYICVGGKLLTCDFNYKKCIELNRCQIYRNGAKLPSNIQQLSINCCIALFCEEQPVFSWFIPVPYGPFSGLKEINISDCKRIKKLFSSDCVLQNLQNLVQLYVSYCKEMKEIIASESELEEEGTDSSNSIKLALPKLRKLLLCELPKLKSICGANGALVCDSVERVQIYYCPKLKRIPLYLPLLEDDRPSPPPSLQKIQIGQELWENMEWDHSYAISLLDPFVEYYDKVQ
ncbi:probable disease resistance protein At1g61300 [Durio zibethinus]|uniref:Probable disease resistance protein At1g61300 n=1 Tax=Durio zibethinus TaxID=66656 RepID=A0A6P5X1T7_DURZI|nr:probable disease resistance protein At1g61300 [Durio zibethinus]